MEELVTLEFIPAESWDETVTTRNYDTLFYKDQHNWTNLTVFNNLLVPCAELIYKYHPEIDDPLAFIGSKVYEKWALLNGPLSDASKISKGPGDVYDLVWIYTKIFNVMRELYVAKKKKYSRIIINRLEPGISSPTQDPSEPYINNGILLSIPCIALGLPPAKRVDPIISRADVKTLLDQDIVFPRVHIKSEFAENGNLIINGEVYGQIVELEGEPIQATKDRIVHEIAYLGKIKRYQIPLDEVNLEKLHDGQIQPNGRQFAVLITKDLLVDISGEEKSDCDELEDMPNKNQIKILLGKSRFVLKKGHIYNAPYSVIHLVYQAPTFLDRFIQLLKSSGEFKDELSKKTNTKRGQAIDESNWIKLLRVIFNRKMIKLPKLLFNTAVRVIDTAILSIVNEMLASHHAALERQKAHEKLEKLFQDTLVAISTSIEARDEYTRGHTQRVAQLAKRLAERMGYDQETTTLTQRAGYLHDAGKIGIRDEVLLKRGKLTEEEFAIMKSHTNWVRDILTKGINSPELHEIAKIAAAHHECPDGTGYPDGLTADQIPLPAKMLAFADVWDALTSERKYRDTPIMPSNVALKILIIMTVIECLGPQEMLINFIEMVEPGFTRSQLFTKIIWDIYHEDIRKEEDREKFRTNPSKYRVNTIELLNRAQPEILAENPNFFEDNAPI